MTTTDADAPFGRTPAGKPYKTAAAAKRAQTMTGHHAIPEFYGWQTPADLARLHADARLARHRSEIAARMSELRPAVDEHALLTRALDALEKVR